MRSGTVATWNESVEEVVMSSNWKQRIASVLAVASALALNACGNSGNSGGGAPVVAGGGNYSGASAVGCARIDGPIGFQITNAYVDSANLVGGNLPYAPRNYNNGISYVTGQVVNGPYASRPNSRYGRVYASIVQGLNYPYNSQWGGAYPYQSYPNNTYSCQTGNCAYGGSPHQATVTGTIWISGTEIYQQILAESGSYVGGSGVYSYGNSGFFTYPGVGYQAYPQYSIPCVSHVAVNLGKMDPIGYNSPGELYGGDIFLYMNNSASGYVLHF